MTTELILIIVAAALGGVIGTSIYQNKLLKPVADIIKAIIPGKSIEPKVGQILVDLGKMLQNGDEVHVRVENTNGDKKDYYIENPHRNKKT
jgi:hypothetical protein